MQIRIVLWSVVSACLFPLTAFAQFGDTKTKGAQLDKPLVQRYEVKIRVGASGGPCKGIIGSAPVPFDWPEQQVKIVDQDVSPLVKKVDYRMLNGSAKQMLVQIPQIPAGTIAHATITFEVSRHALLPPPDTTIFQIPKKLDRSLLIFTGPSPFIEAKHPKIAKAAREALSEKESASAWEKVEALYDYTRAKVEYKNGPLKGALKALDDGNGDCEELSSLFIALCRSQDIPARIVWVPGHCYAEFYLVDDEGVGHWLPCQPAGAKAFGGIPEHRPILQKGDNFRDPDRPSDKLRYVNEFLKGAAVKGGGQPKVSFSGKIVN